MKNSLVNRLGIGATATVIGLGANSLDANAQNKSEYKKHDKGASFSKYESTSNDILEEKVIYNPVTGKDEPFYIQNLNTKERKRYENDLNIGAMSSDELKSSPMVGVKSSDIYAIISSEFYHFFPEERDKLVLEETHIKNLCIDQKKLLAEGINPETMTVSEANKKANELRGDNYIFKSNISDYIKSFTGNNILNLGDDKSYIVFPLSEEQQEEGKMNFVLMEDSDDNYWIPEKNEENGKKNIAFHGKFYRGILEVEKIGSIEKPVPAIIDAKSGLVGRLESGESGEIIKKAKEEIDKEHKKGNFYWIIGANGNKTSFGGDFGVGYGPVALVGHLGGSKDENLINYNIPSPNTGREYITTKDNLDISKWGGAGELRLFQNNFVSPFIFAGANKTTYTQSNQEGGTKNSLVKKEWNGKGGGGVSLGKNHKIDIYGLWDSRKIPELNNPNHKNSSKQLSVGVRGVIKF